MYLCVYAVSFIVIFFFFLLRFNSFLSWNNLIAFPNSISNWALAEMPICYLGWFLKSCLLQQQSSGIGGNYVNLWSAQCGECFKWRLIPTEEEFEKIRSKFTEDPFVCSKIPHICCNDPAEIEYDNTRIWAIHKPNTPQTPKGFKRRIKVRKNFTRADCYYHTPNGKILRSLTQVPKFLDKYPNYKQTVSVEDFCFSMPKIMGSTAKKVWMISLMQLQFGYLWFFLFFLLW